MGKCLFYLTEAFDLYPFLGPKQNCVIPSKVTSGDPVRLLTAQYYFCFIVKNVKFKKNFLQMASNQKSFDRLPIGTYCQIFSWFEFSGELLTATAAAVLT